MPLDLNQSIEVTEPLCANRVGMARLAKMAFDGADLRPLCRELTAKLLDGTAEAGEGLDLSLIAQLLGDKPTGLAVQQEILASHQLFRSPCLTDNPRLSVLALAAATDMGSNTPIEFLLEESGVGKVGHHVPNRGGAQSFAVGARERARSDGLTRGDESFHQGG